MEKVLVIQPTDPATKRTTALLFHPFNKKLWLTIALAAALTLLGESEFLDLILHLIAALLDQIFNLTNLSANLPTLDDTLKWLPTHTAQLLLYMLALTILGTALYLLYRYLNARAQFILFDYTTRNDTHFKQSWRTHKTLARNLFKFRIYWDLILFNAFLLVAILAILIALPDLKPVLSGNPYTFSAWSLTALIISFLLSSLLAIALWIAGSIFHYMVIPLMYLHQTPAWPTFKRAYHTMFRPHIKACLAYFLLQIIASSAIRILTLLGILLLSLLTCGIGFLLALIPLLGAITLYPLALTALPALIWQRAYTLNFIHQFPNPSDL